MDRQKRMFELAQKIHQLLVDHCAEAVSESESTCILGMAHALWRQSPTLPDSTPRTSSQENQFDHQESPAVS